MTVIMVMGMVISVVTVCGHGDEHGVKCGGHGYHGDSDVDQHMALVRVTTWC